MEYSDQRLMILAQCLYGGTPFVDEDRTKTKLKILVCLEIYPNVRFDS